MQNNKHKLTSKSGLKKFLNEDVGASNDDIKRISNIASRYTDKVPYGKDALNILDDMIEDSPPARSVRAESMRREQPANNRQRETYFNPGRYKINK